MIHEKGTGVMKEDASNEKVKVIDAKHRSEDLRQIKKDQETLLMSAEARNEEKIEILEMMLIEQRRQLPHVQ